MVFLLSDCKSHNNCSELLTANEIITTNPIVYVVVASSLCITCIQVESPSEEASGSGTDSCDKLRPGALDKMVALVSGLVERSRDAAGQLALADPDARALLHAKVAGSGQLNTLRPMFINRCHV